MAIPGARMRLTVVVEALAEENAHGEFRDMALAAFKERKFAMPVQLDDTFETVWSDIEHRYKTNYLSPQQAATFSIKKLQDAYDCDLDMTDTVGAIFEGEPDRKMHLIKVVPHFVFRETSVVPGSMLRPQKRVGDDLDDPDHSANKRRRVESQQRQRSHDERLPSPNRPVPSTEVVQPAAPASGEAMDTDARSVRSRSGLSLVELHGIETGQAPFPAAGVKQESPEPPELLQPPALNGNDNSMSEEPVEQPTQTATRQSTRLSSPRPPYADTLHEQSQAAPQLLDDELSAAEHGATGDAQTGLPQHTASPHRGSQEAAIHQSPVSSSEPEHQQEPEITSARPTRARRDVYRVPSSPEFMHKKATPDKPAKTYGRSPHSGAELLNMARRLGRTTKDAHHTQTASPASITNKARAFQRIQPDDIESTPQEQNASSLLKNDAIANNDDDDDGDLDLTASFLDQATEATTSSRQGSARKKAIKPVKPGSLKKPSRASLLATPVGSTDRGTKSRFAATPATADLADKSRLKAQIATPASAGSSKSEKSPNGQTLSRIERLQLLMSQSTPQRRSSASSSARSTRLSPEVRIPVAKKFSPVSASVEASDAPPSIPHPTPQTKSNKSPAIIPPSSTKRPGSVTRATPRGAGEASKVAKQNVFKKPGPSARETAVQSTSAKKPSVTPTGGTPRRSEVPLPPNVRHLRRSSSLQSSPLANGDNNANKPIPKSSSNTSVNPEIDPSSSHPTTTNNRNIEPSEPNSNGAIVISSAEPSSTEDSSSDEGEEFDVNKRGIDTVTNTGSVPAESHAPAQIDNGTVPSEAAVNDEKLGDEVLGQPDDIPKAREAENTPVDPAFTQDKPPSGQDSSQAVPWNAASWDFGHLNKAAHTNGQPEQVDEAQPSAATNVAPASEDEGFADQETYSTAIEDNASRSRSSSAALSTRSSPAVSRRPARFLSHSPTPDTSDSEDDSEASAVASRAASLQANGKDESESDSDSSSDSSDNDDVEMPDQPAKSTTEPKANTVPASSPPLKGPTSSTPVVPETSQPTSSQIKPPTQRTPVPPPTQQSSQIPRSSQSVSVQAADRRRYTGFRSLREQLADTKAAQATTQKKTFDPRTMSLGKLAKGKPLTGLRDDESSDDESSSSSDSSDSD